MMLNGTVHARAYGSVISYALVVECVREIEGTKYI